MKFGLRYASLGRYSQGAAAVELAQAAEAAGFESITWWCRTGTSRATRTPRAGAWARGSRTFPSPIR